jgi:hypothetical protein
MGNFDEAVKAEAKRVVRIFHAYSSDQRATLASHHRTSRSRKAIDGGEFFYTHPSVPGIAFRTRFAAAEYAVELPSA